MSAVLVGLLVASAAAGSLNTHLSTDGASLAAVVPPYHSSIALTVDTPAPVRLLHLGIQRPRVLGYQPVHSYFDDFYQRIHITPDQLSMGNISGVQQRSIAVWNAYVDASQTLTAVPTTGATGITITAPAALPQVFAPLAQWSWAIAVSSNGPPVVNATISWVFTGLPAPVASITGNRIAAWVWRPNWANGVIERDTWLTDILQADAGAEQRVALRLTPRRLWEFSLVATGAARQWLESAIFDWSARVWALPVWTDVQRLPSAVVTGSTILPVSPVDRDYVAGGLALLWADAVHYEIAEVSSLGSTLALSQGLLAGWPAGTRVYPMRAARLVAAPKSSSPTADVLLSSVQFRSAEPLSWPAISPTTLYRTLPVLEIEPLYTAPRPQHIERLLNTLDNQISQVDVTDSAGIGYPALDYQIRLDTPAARASWRSITYAIRGAQGVLWVPTWKLDLSAVGSYLTTSVSLDVTACGLARYIKQQAGRRDIRIEFRDGTILYRRVIAAVAAGPATERITLDSAIGITGTAADIRRISWLVASRLQADAIEYSHATAHVSHVQVTFRGVPDDV